MHHAIRIFGATALLFTAICPARADVLVFDDRAAWRAAISEPDALFEDFESFDEDVPYTQNTPVNAGFITLSVVDGGADNSWRIDVMPATFTSIPTVDGSNFATVLGFFGGSAFGDTQLSVPGLRALGFDYSRGSYSSSDGLLTTDLGDDIVLPSGPVGSTGFVGILYTGSESFDSVVISAVSGAFGVGVDNVEGYVQLCLPVDTDADGVLDQGDNCRTVSNADQRDTNGDGFGNACDADLDNDGRVNAVDLGLLRTAFFQSGDLDADFNGDQIVNPIDLGVLKNSFFGVPGPSCVAGGSD